LAFAPFIVKHKLYIKQRRVAQQSVLCKFVLGEAQVECRLWVSFW